MKIRLGIYILNFLRVTLCIYSFNIFRMTKQLKKNINIIFAVYQIKKINVHLWPFSKVNKPKNYKSSSEKCRKYSIGVRIC